MTPTLAVMEVLIPTRIGAKSVHTSDEWSRLGSASRVVEITKNDSDDGRWSIGLNFKFLSRGRERAA